MPPRRSARVAAAAEQRAWAFPQLPLPVALQIFRLLPADQRLRCAEVCRGWRATVALPALWARLDLSPTSGVAQPASLALLHAAVTRAGSALTALDVSGMRVIGADFAAVLLAALQADAMPDVGAQDDDERLMFDMRCATAFLAATPQLRELHTEILCDCADVAAFSEPPAPVRARVLDVWTGANLRALSLPLPPVLFRSLAADNALHPGLARVRLFGLDLRTPGVLEALADAVCARPLLSALDIEACALSPAAAPALARALRHGALATLTLSGGWYVPLIDSVAVVADALRDCRTLTALSLSGIHMPQFAAAAAAALLGALVGHASLRKLQMTCNIFVDPAAAGAALAALLAADVPALTELDVHDSDLGGAGLAPLCDALPRNTHLRRLDVRANQAPVGFTRGRLLPAVRARASLREQRAVPDVADDEDEMDLHDLAAAHEAEGIVEAR